MVMMDSSMPARPTDFFAGLALAAWDQHRSRLASQTTWKRALLHCLATVQRQRLLQLQPQRQRLLQRLR